jgi:hypothetical protein
MTTDSDETLNSFGVIPVIAVSACLMGDKVRFDGGMVLSGLVATLTVYTSAKLN